LIGLAYSFQLDGVFHVKTDRGHLIDLAGAVDDGCCSWSDTFNRESRS